MTETIIYVYLPWEGVDLWAIAFAERVRDDVYRIVDCLEEGHLLQFGEGELVRCRLQRFSADHEHLTAYERAVEM
jgi:hypothetical protein